MQIRRFRPADAPALADIFYRAVREMGARFYSDAQVRAWAPEPPDARRYLDHAASGRLILVAVDEGDAPVAYGDLEPDGHIDHLFCTPEWTGRGLGSALCEAIERAALSRGLAGLYVEASEAARPVFERKGFELVERRDFELRGARINHYRMRKTL
jgi:putative acetyltransferase